MSSIPCCFIDTLPSSTQQKVRTLIECIHDNQENVTTLERLLQKNLHLINTYPSLFPSFIVPLLHKLGKTQV